MKKEVTIDTELEEWLEQFRPVEEVLEELTPKMEALWEDPEFVAEIERDMKETKENSIDVFWAVALWFFFLFGNVLLYFSLMAILR